MCVYVCAGVHAPCDSHRNVVSLNMRRRLDRRSLWMSTERVGEGVLVMVMVMVMMAMHDDGNNN